MIDNIIAISVKNRLGVLIGIGAIIIWGFISLQKLPLDAVPDITNNQVVILMNAPNLAPVEIEQYITTPIELEMSSIPKLTEIRSTSKFGLSVVTLIFDDEVELYWARAQVFERLSKLDIPEEFGKPYLAPVTTGLGEIFQYIIKPKNPKDTSHSLTDLRTIQDWVIRKQLLGTEGVAEVSSFGGYVKEYQAIIDPIKMKSVGVTINELFRAIEDANGNMGGSYIEKDKRAYLIRGIGLIKDLDDLKKAAIKFNKDVPIKVADVAEVRFGQNIRNGAMTLNGEKEVVGGVIMMQIGENAHRVIKNIKSKMQEIQQQLPDDLVIEPFIDREKLVDRTINTVALNLTEGAIIVLLVLIIFLGDIRAALIAASVIPITMLFTFGMMIQFKLVGNLMSLGALDFGLIVDGSVIVVEGVAFGLSYFIKKMGSSLSYAQRKEVVIQEMAKIKKSVFFGGLIILIVYFPLLTLTGTEGRMFSPLTKTVSIAIVGALLLSITYVPMMCAWLMTKPHHEGSLSDRLVDFLYRFFEPQLRFSLQYRWVVLGATLAVFLFSLYLFGKLGAVFMPKFDEGDFAIETRLPVGTSLSETMATASKIQRELLRKFPQEIKGIVGKHGTSEIPTDPMPLEAVDLIITLEKDRSKWVNAQSKDELAEKIAMVFKEFAGVTISIQQPIENRFNELISGAKTDVVFSIFGKKLETLTAKSNELVGLLGKVEGATDINVVKIDGLPQLNVTYDRDAMLRYGVSIDQMNEVIETAYAGKVAGVAFEGDRRYNIVARLANFDRSDFRNFESLLILTDRGDEIPLSQLATISTNIGPTEIRHLTKSRAIQVGVNVRGRDIESLVKEVESLIKTKMELPPGYTIEFGGQFKNLLMARERLSVVVPVALVIIFGLLFTTFGNIKDSLLIFTLVPLSLIGGVFGLYIRQIPFSISAGV
ncbi:MAG TPA: CusA/CzcA family heavy metal efflux RND transporter, partial [Microscillaceae bacterium]|nr:CusA/CzcA family heavy metal efflux RND transporter [Microscillaceae bacterium]